MFNVIESAANICFINHLLINKISSNIKVDMPIFSSKPIDLSEFSKINGFNLVLNKENKVSNGWINKNSSINYGGFIDFKNQSHLLICVFYLNIKIRKKFVLFLVSISFTQIA